MFTESQDLFCFQANRPFVVRRGNSGYEDDENDEQEEEENATGDINDEEIDYMSIQRRIEAITAKMTEEVIL